MKKTTITTISIILIVATAFFTYSYFKKQNKEKQSSLVSLDKTWNLYTNKDYGFSIKVPKEMFHGYGTMCRWDGESYRPKGGTVPVKIFEGDDGVYISGEYFYELGGEKIENNSHYYSECNKVQNSLTKLEQNRYFQQQYWKFVTKDIKNDGELDVFIKERYGSGCSLGSKVASEQEGVYEVKIQGDGKDLGETACPLNYATVVKYYPAKNKVISWHLGQAATFVADQNYQTIYDQEMLKSFEFK